MLVMLISPRAQSFVTRLFLIEIENQMLLAKEVGILYLFVIVNLIEIKRSISNF
jgi:hypothetical protein